MKNLNVVHLNSLRAVEAVGRLGGLATAADELGVTIGAVSQQIQKMERQIGRPLFDRRPKGIMPNALGEEVIARLTAGMAELSAAVKLARGDNEKVLTVSTAPVFAGKWLVWRLNRFHDTHPGIRIRLDANANLVDPDLSDVDVCIRVGRGEWPGLRAEKILDQRIFPVCSPALADQLAEPRDLARLPIIRDPATLFDWQDWFGPLGLDASILGEGPEYSDGSLCLDAAVAGQGVFLAWETLANDALRMGRLVAPFPERQKTGLAYWFITGRHAATQPRIRAFRQWLMEELAASVGSD